MCAVRTGLLTLSTGNIKDSTFFWIWQLERLSVSLLMKKALLTSALWKALSLFITRDVGKLLSSAHVAEKHKNRPCLITITENVCFLARQGLGDGNEEDGIVV